MLGNPARQLTREQHLIKLHRCWTFAADSLAPDASERLVEAVDRLEELEDVRLLTELSPIPAHDRL
jgi:hypothetical protein